MRKCHKTELKMDFVKKTYLSLRDYGWRYTRSKIQFKLFEAPKQKLLDMLRKIPSSIKICDIIIKCKIGFKNRTITRSVNEEKNCPLVSVVIPVYDRTKELVESIESILGQTYPNVELICVCDGSPEETRHIIEQYEGSGQVRAFYYDDNSGNAVRGRNRAIREAKGEYLAFQDSDDIAEPTRIAESVRTIEKYRVDVVYGAYRVIVDGNRNIGIENGTIVQSPDCDLSILLTTNVICQSSVMARISALRRVGGLKPELKYREDHELWLRLAYYGYKFKSISRVLTNLRIHENNLELRFKDSDEYWKSVMLQQYKVIMDEKPKIVYIIPGVEISGGIAVICQHVNRLLRLGYPVCMISEDNNTCLDWFPHQMVEIFSVENAPKDIDIAVATGWSTAYTVQKMNVRRKMYFVQSDETRFYPKDDPQSELARKTYSMDFEFLTEARWIQQWLKKEYGKESTYVPNGIDKDIFHRVCYKENERRKVRVLLEGSIAIPYKGMSDAFAAVKGLNCEVWCISSAGRPKPNWKCDKFFHHVDMDKMRYIYSKCDILLKMSRVEGFFGPPMEMMACGGTCVVGKVTGYDEYIVDGQNALVVDLGDVAGAHRALQKLINDEGLRKLLIEGGQKTVSEWKWDKSIEILDDLYSKQNSFPQ